MSNVFAVTLIIVIYLLIGFIFLGVERVLQECANPRYTLIKHHYFYTFLKVGESFDLDDNYILLSIFTLILWPFVAPVYCVFKIFSILFSKITIVLEKQHPYETSLNCDSAEDTSNIKKETYYKEFLNNQRIIGTFSKIRQINGTDVSDYDILAFAYKEGFEDGISVGANNVLESQCNIKKE